MVRGTDGYGTAFAAAVLLATATPAAAQDAARDYRIEEQELGQALRAFAVASDREVIADAELLAGKRARRVVGRYDPATALRLLLTGTGLVAELVEGAFVVREDALAESTGTPPEGPAQDVVVTGTRIRGAGPVGAPVTVIDRTALAQSGRGTIQSLLETLPSNFGGGQNEGSFGTTSRNGAGENQGLGASINLRGLGAAATLVLFDGNRPALGGTNGTFADISLIPQIAVERIEVLTDGASAIYGTDAVAGVVNLRFRNRFEGAESFARLGTADGDFGEQLLGQIVGRRWGSGGLVLAYQYSGRDALSSAERDYATSDLRAFGGPDARSRFTAPGTIIAANGATFGIPAGQDGRGLTAAQLLPGAAYRRDRQREVDLLPEQRSHAAYAAFDQELGGGLELFARGFWAQRRYTIFQPIGAEAPVTVPVTNAFYVDPIGDRRAVTVLYDFGADLGREHRDGSVKGLSAIGGARADLGPWAIEVAGNYGVQRTAYDGRNLLNRFRLAQALADPNPATAYNLFGDGGDTSPATLDAVRGQLAYRLRYQVWTATFRADGPLFRLPTGLVRIAVGAEHRDERIRGGLTSLTRTAAPVVTPLQPGLTHRDVDAVYGEALLPLSGDTARWLPGTLDLSIAARTEWYSDVGRTFNPKAGLAWRPRPGVTLRGTYGTSFHAPSFGDQIGTGFNLYQPYELPDPQSPTGRSIALGLFGFADDLGPEKARSWTAGVDLADWPVPGLAASATYFHIRYRDRIATATAEYLNFLTRRDLYGALVSDADPATVARYFADPLFVNPLRVTPDQIDVIADGRTQNLAATSIRGLDFDLGYRHAAGGGDAAIGVAGTRLFAIDQRITAASPAANVVAVLGNPVKLRLRGRATWTTGGLQLGAFVNHVGAYRNQTRTPVERVAAWTTVDVRIAFGFEPAAPLGNAELALSALNLFDRDPPYVTNQFFSSSLGYDPEQANPVGRQVAVQFTARW